MTGVHVVEARAAAGQAPQLAEPVRALTTRLPLQPQALTTRLTTSTSISHAHAQLQCQ